MYKEYAKGTYRHHCWVQMRILNLTEQFDPVDQNC